MEYEEFKCKSCGSTLRIYPNVEYITCDYCGTIHKVNCIKSNPTSYSINSQMGNHPIEVNYILEEIKNLNCSIEMTSKANPLLLKAALIILNSYSRNYEKVVTVKINGYSGWITDIVKIKKFMQKERIGYLGPYNTTTIMGGAISGWDRRGATPSGGGIWENVKKNSVDMEMSKRQDRIKSLYESCGVSGYREKIEEFSINGKDSISWGYVCEKKFYPQNAIEIPNNITEIINKIEEHDVIKDIAIKMTNIFRTFKNNNESNKTILITLGRKYVSIAKSPQYKGCDGGSDYYYTDKFSSYYNFNSYGMDELNDDNIYAAFTIVLMDLVTKGLKSLEESAIINNIQIIDTGANDLCITLTTRTITKEEKYNSWV